MRRARTRRPTACSPPGSRGCTRPCPARCGPRRCRSASPRARQTPPRPGGPSSWGRMRGCGSTRESSTGPGRRWPRMHDAPALATRYRTPGVLQARAADALGIAAGDILLVGAPGQQRQVLVTGTWLPNDPAAARWFGDPAVISGFDGTAAGPLMVDESWLATLPAAPHVRWTVTPDTSRFLPEDVPALGAALSRIGERLDNDAPISGRHVAGARQPGRHADEPRAKPGRRARHRDGADRAHRHDRLPRAHPAGQAAVGNPAPGDRAAARARILAGRARRPRVGRGGGGHRPGSGTGRPGRGPAGCAPARPARRAGHRRLGLARAGDRGRRGGAGGDGGGVAVGPRPAPGPAPTPGARRARPPSGPPCWPSAPPRCRCGSSGSTVRRCAPDRTAPASSTH